jgi:urea carboxylase-associated protein 2
MHYFFGATTYEFPYCTVREQIMKGAEVRTARSTPMWEVALEPGEHWSGILRRGTTLRMTARGDCANVSAALYNFESLLERYNMADTLKAQHTAYLTKGHVLYSDMGRVLCSLTDDSCGWHDTICGVSDAALVEERYGISRFDGSRNDFHKNGRDSLLNELGKYGLGKRDLISTVNFFTRVYPNDAGELTFDETHSKAGDYVELRFEMNALLVLTTCQHPLDPSPGYRPRGAILGATFTGPAPAKDHCRDLCPENGRGFSNTEALFAP